jgi:hypothetical protein
MRPRKTRVVDVGNYQGAWRLCACVVFRYASQKISLKVE